MMHGHEKSDLAIVAGKRANTVALRCGAVRGGVSPTNADIRAMLEKAIRERKH
jgi:hypothetical protein